MLWVWCLVGVVPCGCGAMWVWCLVGVVPCGCGALWVWYLVGVVPYVRIPPCPLLLCVLCVSFLVCLHINYYSNVVMDLV